MEWPMVTEREFSGSDYQTVVVRNKAMAMARYKEMALCGLELAPSGQWKE